MRLFQLDNKQAEVHCNNRVLIISLNIYRVPKLKEHLYCIIIKI
jgi:hypothetical protein